MKKIKKILQNENIKTLILFSSLFLFFFLIDLFFRIIYAEEVSIYVWYKKITNLFTICYSLLFALIIYSLPRKIGKLVFIISSTITYIFLFIQSFHFKAMGRFFGIDDIFFAGEASAYLKTFHLYLNIKVVIMIIFFILFGIFILKMMKNQKSKNKVTRIFTLSVCVFIILLRVFTDYSLGKEVSYEENWDAWNNERNIYNNFSEQNRSFYLTGLYEYTYRSSYLYFKNKINDNSKDIKKEVKKYLKENKKTKEKNDYTGYFENKNLLYIHLESIDSWMLNDAVMPTLTKFSKEGINFTNRFGPMFGTGATFGSEFTLNTGLLAPHSGAAANTYTKNNYDNSLPNLFKNKGYKVNSLHMNKGSFYNRKQMHLAFGYENHYALADMGFNFNKAIDDRYLVQNKDVYNLMVNKKEKFMTFVTTYSPHMPYDLSNSLCYKERFKRFSKDDETLACAKAMSTITDDFIKELIKKLEKDKLLDNTVLVFVTDHYTYSYPDEKKLSEIKGTDNRNMMTETPFIIWSKDIRKEENDKIISTIDILPTLANMFKLDYEPTNYLGNDVYSKNYKGYSFFPDRSYFDGQYHDVYNITEKEKSIVNEIDSLIKTNDKILRSDFFKK
jgi:Phosphoglycerol transferase and related proteins, alkaline phosphatase superfamily